MPVQGGLRDPGAWKFRLVLAFWFGTGIFVAAGFASQTNRSSPANSDSSPPTSNAYVGNEACSRCHNSIYDSYMRTPMAHASGPATENLTPADFVHEKSGVHYRICTEGDTAWLSFERPGDPGVNGKRQLLYFIGSGRRGRTYLFAVDGFVFESPVDWYADQHVWDMAPAYGGAREIPMNLPAYASCFECHTSGMQPPLRGTENRYPMPVFTQDGVACERCHGPGTAHINGGSIVNPVKLAPELRDAVCMQCHLEGKVGIGRPGRHAYEFNPGDKLSDYVRHYVLAGNQASSRDANSQFEALAQSACKKKSGDSMSCMNCHDPHYSPSVNERGSYYRGKCLACHGAAFGAKHHPKDSGCIACHMPSSLSANIAHSEVTDHRIPRRPGSSAGYVQGAAPQQSAPSLIRFPKSKGAHDDVRDLALAWESLAEDGVLEAASQAGRFLRLAATQSPDDPAVLSSLAYVELKQGAINHAEELYRKALALDPTLIDAATNLGVIEARSGHLHSAIDLWQGAFDRAPGKSTIGMNLARTLCESGQREDARAIVLRVLQFNPDLSAARKLLQHLNADPPNCGS